ncbi:SEC14 cytosolic factor family protein / phosphoglyceride transfer family protein [Perilla frutescens var. hirtella]|nr:SEC14 cytosolic factor family protein / phosphoglyceride transfer family protein [Perilla frutescens var. hirtella]
MAEQVEKMPHEEQPPPPPPQEAVLTVSDVPSPEQTPKHDNASLLVPEADDLMIPASPTSAEDKAPLSPPPPEADHADKLPESEMKALQELKQLLQHALNHATPAPPPPPNQESDKDNNNSNSNGNHHHPSRQTIATTLLEDDGAKTLEAIEETIISCARTNPASKKCTPPKSPEQEESSSAAAASLYGVKLLEDDRSDVILLKFLRARDFRVKDAFAMLNNTLKWRREFGVDDEDKDSDAELDSQLERAVFMHGRSKHGHPVCYNVYGEFRDADLYQKMFSDEEKRQRFLRWRIRFMEKSIKKFDFGPGRASTIVQVNDLKNSPGPNRWELRRATNQALQLFQDNYPEFVAKQIFINVPWWYLVLNKMISPFLTQRTKSKFVVAGPSKSAETLLKYISAEQTPAQYGGLSKEGDFGFGDSVTEIVVRPSAKHIVEFPVNQGSVVSWEARVVGWEVNYGAEFVPSAEDGYTIIIQKSRRIGSNEEQVVCSSYKVCEKGKLLLTFNNPTSKKKMLLYRFKTKVSN